MKKIGIFVEGQTEQIFLERLIEEIAGRHNVAFHIEQWFSKQFTVLKSELVNDEQFFILIVDCCSDGAVVSAILSRYSGLEAANYDLILGLRDLFPLLHTDLLNLKSGIASVLPQGALPVHVTIAVAEIEAWFVQENTHFPRIDPQLSSANIHAQLGYDITTALAEDLLNPASTLNEIYQLAGKAYSKSKKRVGRTVGALDMGHLYLDRRAMLSSYDEFVGRLDNFFGF